MLSYTAMVFAMPHKKEQIAGVVSAGDVLIFRDGKWYKDAKATKERTQHIKNLMDSVWED